MGCSVYSLESSKFAEAELVPVTEGRTWTVVMRDGIAPPG